MKSKLINQFCLFLGFFGALYSVNAQKVDLDPWRFSVEYRHLPNNPLDKSYQTYNVFVETTGTFRDAMSDRQIQDMVVLEGWKSVEGKGHITVNVLFKNFIVNKTRVSERTEDIKDKDGKVTGKNYYYKPIMEYQFDGYCNAVTMTKENLTSQGYGGAQTWSGSESSTYKEASDYLENNRNALRDQLTRQHITDGVNNFKNILNANYGYPKYRNNDLVYLLDTKKHPDYEGHQKVVKALKEDLTKHSATESIEKMKETFAPLMKYLEETVTKYPKDEKGDKKMRYAAYYAMGKISYWLDDPDATIKYGELLIANKYDEKDGKELIKWANELKAVFAKNKTNSRYFAIDLTNVEAPSANSTAGGGK
jgi:hypothetical protein